MTSQIKLANSQNFIVEMRTFLIAKFQTAKFHIFIKAKCRELHPFLRLQFCPEFYAFFVVHRLAL